MRIFFTLITLAFLSVTIDANAQQQTTATGTMPGMYKKLIHFNNPNKDNCTLTIADSTGKTIKAIDNIKADTITIDLQMLNRGKYNYTIVNPSGTELKHGIVMGRHLETKTEVAPNKGSSKH